LGRGGGRQMVQNWRSRLEHSMTWTLERQPMGEISADTTTLPISDRPAGGKPVLHAVGALGFVHQAVGFLDALAQGPAGGSGDTPTEVNGKSTVLADT